MKSFSKRSVTARAVEEGKVRRDLDEKAASEHVAGSAESAWTAERVGSPRSKPATIRSSWIPQIEEAVRKSCEYFYRVQYPEGYWWAELESNVSITCEYVMLKRLLGIPLGRKQSSIVRYLLKHQNENGGWGIYLGDGGEISTTVEAYFALKLLGQDPESEPLAKARTFILQRGGIESTRVFTKMWLALFDQYEWNKVPSMPVELVLLPPELYFSFYEFSSWARGTAIPLSVVLCIRPKFRLPDSLCIQELWIPARKKLDSRINKLFWVFDRVAKRLEEKADKKASLLGDQGCAGLDHRSSGGDRRLGRHPASHGLFDACPALPGVFPFS